MSSSPGGEEEGQEEAGRQERRGANEESRDGSEGMHLNTQIQTDRLEERQEEGRSGAAARSRQRGGGDSGSKLGSLFAMRDGLRRSEDYGRWQVGAMPEYMENPGFETSGGG